MSFQEKETVKTHGCINLVGIRHLKIKNKEFVKLFNEVEVIPWSLILLKDHKLTLQNSFCN